MIRRIPLGFRPVLTYSSSSSAKTIDNQLALPAATPVSVPSRVNPLISGRDIVVLSDNWDGLPNSTMHLVRCLLPNNRVFWLNMIGRMPRVCRRDIYRTFEVIRQWCRASNNGRGRSYQGDGPTQPNPIVASPFIIPWFKPPARRLNAFGLRRTYNALAERYSIRSPIVITTAPASVDLVKSMHEAVKIYYCVDDWEAYPGINGRDWRRMEEQLFDEIDGLVVTSSALYSKATRELPQLLLPQGVDFEHFSSTGSTSEIPELIRLPKPIVGFFGTVGAWIDLDVIATLSKDFPEVSFVFIGPIEVSETELPRARNLHYFGKVSYELLPSYASRFDVGLIPFVDNQLTRAVNPLKMYEYYALGLPVLATKLPELAAADGPMFLAANAKQFSQQLGHVLQQLSPEMRRKATAVAGSNTWSQRARLLSNFIRDAELRRHQSSAHIAGR